jgi:hypothetical protein
MALSIPLATSHQPQLSHCSSAVLPDAILSANVNARHGETTSLSG